MNSISAGKIDTLPRSDVKQMQFQLLKKQLDYVWRKSKFYRRKFGEAGITPDSIKTLKDIEKIPFTTKKELKAFHDDFICVPGRMIVDVGSTTGTTGDPILLPVTERDWNRLVGTIKRNFLAIGTTRDDVVQLTVAFDQLFPAGITGDYALKEIGATVVRTGPGNTKRQIEIMKRLKSTIIYASPDYMFTLAETAREMGYDPRRDFSLRKGIYHGSPLYYADQQPTMLNKRIAELWGIEDFGVYGSMEMLTAMVDCPFHAGYHSHPDWVYLEIIDPVTGEVLDDDFEGELVATTLMREGIPIIRFRQGDITSLQTEKCGCGKTSPRVRSIVGRAGNMLKIKGSSVYPQQIEELLMNEPGITNYAVEAYDDDNGCEAIKIMVGLREPQDGLVTKIKRNCKARLRITPAIEVFSPDEILEIWYRHGNKKPCKFKDLRR